MRFRKLVESKMLEGMSWMECEDMPGYEVLTIARDEQAENEPEYVLNFEIDDDKITVNTIDKDAGKLVDTFEEPYESEEDLVDVIDTAINTYDSIVDNKPSIIQKLSFDDLMSAEDWEDRLKALTAEELTAFSDYVNLQHLSNCCVGVMQQYINHLQNKAPEEPQVEETSAEILSNFIDTLSAEKDSCDDDMLAHIYDDICADANMMYEELSRIVK